MNYLNLALNKVVNLNRFAWSVWWLIVNFGDYIYFKPTFWSITNLFNEVSY